MVGVQAFLQTTMFLDGLERLCDRADEYPVASGYLPVFKGLIFIFWKKWKARIETAICYA